MRENFEKCLEAMLVHEGGFVSNPHDPGGATCNGVTQAVYDSWREENSLPQQSVRLISHDEVEKIYKQKYWNAVKGDALPSGVDYCVFDFGFNSGPKRAIRYLQNAVGVAADGELGPVSLVTINVADAKMLVRTICFKRLNFLKQLKTWKYFGRGWTKRVNDVQEMAEGMVHASD
jgi:lysozyme family protein